MESGSGCYQILGVISGRSQLIQTQAHVCVNRKNEVVLRPAYALSYSNKAMRSKVYVHAHLFSGKKKRGKKNPPKRVTAPLLDQAGDQKPETFFFLA